MRNIVAIYSALAELQVITLLPRDDALRSAQRLPLATIFRAFGAALGQNLDLEAGVVNPSV